MIFEVIVVGKCDREKELLVYVWKHRVDIDGKKPPGRQLRHVGCYDLKGIIRDYEIVKHLTCRKRTSQFFLIVRATKSSMLDAI
jgi:hypothetical protein